MIVSYSIHMKIWSILFQGVKFLYDCVTGKRIENSFGCVMADEMVCLLPSFR